MAYTNLGQNALIPWPTIPGLGLDAFTTSASNTTLDAQDEEVHFIGNLCLPPGTTSATFDTNTTIQFQAGTVTWNTGTTVRIGVQDVDATTGVPGRGDGAWDCYKDMVAGTDTIATGWNTVTMATGTKSVSNGDLIAICFKCTVKGAETLSLPITYGGSNGFGGGRPILVSNIGSGFVVRSGLAIVAINFNGVYATLFGTYPYTARTLVSFNNTSTPDERASLITIPFGCKIHGFMSRGTFGATSTTFDYILYTSPLSSPSAVSGGSVTVDTDTLYSATAGEVIAMLAAPVEVSAGTQIAIAIRPNGSVNVGYGYITVPNVTVGALLPGGQNWTYCSRSDGSGAFTEVTTTKPLIFALISDIDTGGGGLITHPGMSGGCRG